VARTRDPVGLALAGLVAGAGAGATIITAGTTALRFLQSSGTVERDPDIGFTVIWASLAVGVAAAATVGWSLTSAVDDQWRRGVIGVLSVFGAALLSSVAVPVDLLVGRPGLVAYAVLLSGTTVYAVRHARRSASS